MQDFWTIPGLAGGEGGGGRLGCFTQASAGQQHPAPVKCPRCDSTNTKFCYYNNYNLAQPRHFCKSCRRYWTKGGVLRNVPVGGGCRKSKRSSSSSSSSKSSYKEPIPRRPPSSTLVPADASISTPFPNSTLLALYRDPDPIPTPSLDVFEAAASVAGSNTSMISPVSVPAILGFSSFSDPPSISLQPQPTAAEDVSTQPGFTEQATAVASRTVNPAMGRMEWTGASMDPAIVELSAAAYWSHGHWGVLDADPALYLA